MTDENLNYDVIIVGGGAAGFFGAISIKEIDSELRVAIIESTNHFLKKVKISGGGRCNVTNRIEDPKELIKNYPRGGRKLLNAFYQFGSKEMKTWLAQHGVELKTESDGRVFPQSNSSQTIIDLFYKLCHEYNIDLIKKSKVISIQKEDRFIVFADKQKIECTSILMATGSSRPGYGLAKDLGHEITSLHPSLFTLKSKHPITKDLAGISVQDVIVEIKTIHEGKKIKWQQRGPVLITHWGFSGPAIIKLSAFAAKFFHESNYQGLFKINWLPEEQISKLTERFLKEKKTNRKHISKVMLSILEQKIPKRLIQRFLELNEIQDIPIADISDKKIKSLIEYLLNHQYEYNGKGEFKEEFVTCGGISLGEVSTKTFESQLCSGLYFAGEILDIDGITGGFNFQNAWTSSRLAAFNICESTLKKEN